MSLTDLRARIDSLDDRVLALLSERAEVVEQVGQLKRQGDAPHFHDPERERRVLDRLIEQGAGKFPPQAIRAVFREVMSGCLSLEQPQEVAFLGPEGTFTHMAARHLFGLLARYREAITIDGVFDAVRAGGAAYGVVPIENSTEGPVTHSVDALIEGGLLIRQELVQDVSHCLLGRGAGLSAVERVYSHPQALAQCRGWLAKNLPEAHLLQTPSTAAAAQKVDGDDRAAAIASLLAADLYGIPVLRERIQDRPENATRFLVIAKQDAPRTGDDKTTVAFSVHDERGALRQALAVFEEAQINLSRIESRPGRHKPWDYVFVVDLIGHREDPGVARAIDRLRAHGEMVKVLGSYPRSMPR